MTISGYAPSPHDCPPSKVAPPQNFENTDLYPAVTVKATRTRVGKFSDVVEQEDELGICRVAHFEVVGTLVMFYQSALDTRDHWTVFVDMRGCVAREQLPTRLGRSVIRYLTADSIVPEWVNDEADTEYRSRRRKLYQVDEVATKPTAKRTIRSFLPTTSKARPPHGVANEFRMVMLKDTSTGSGRYLAAKKAATSKMSEVKKATAPAKKAAAVKKAAAPKKVVIKKATSSTK